MADSEKIPLTIRLRSDVREEITDIASREDLSLSQVCERLIDAGIERELRNRAGIVDAYDDAAGHSPAQEAFIYAETRKLNAQAQRMELENRVYATLMQRRIKGELLDVTRLLAVDPGKLEDEFESSESSLLDYEVLDASERDVQDDHEISSEIKDGPESGQEADTERTDDVHQVDTDGTESVLDLDDADANQDEEDASSEAARYESSIDDAAFMGSLTASTHERFGSTRDPNYLENRSQSYDDYSDESDIDSQSNYDDVIESEMVDDFGEDMLANDENMVQSDEGLEDESDGDAALKQSESDESSSEQSLSESMKKETSDKVDTGLEEEMNFGTLGEDEDEPVSDEEYEQMLDESEHGDDDDVEAESKDSQVEYAGVSDDIGGGYTQPVMRKLPQALPPEEFKGMNPDTFREYVSAQIERKAREQGRSEADDDWGEWRVAEAQKYGDVYARANNEEFDSAASDEGSDNGVGNSEDEHDGESESVMDQLLDEGYH